MSKKENEKKQTIPEAVRKAKDAPPPEPFRKREPLLEYKTQPPAEPTRKAKPNKSKKEEG